MTAQEMVVYFAGFFDGEGTVRLAKTYYNRRASGGRTTYHKLHCSVTNSNKDILELYLDRFGGSVYERKGLPEHYKRIWIWTISTQKAFRFLEIIYPYLIEKKEQAMIVLENEAIISNRTGYLLPEEVSQHRERVYQKLRELKGQGYFAQEV